MSPSRDGGKQEEKAPPSPNLPLYTERCFWDGRHLRAGWGQLPWLTPAEHGWPGSLASETIASLFFSTAPPPGAALLWVCALGKNRNLWASCLEGESKQDKKLEPACDFTETNGNTEGLLEGKGNCYHVLCKPRRPCGAVSCTLRTLQILAWPLFKLPSGVNFETLNTQSSV